MRGPHLDRIDLRILQEIQNNGRITVAELSRRVHLTKTPCAERLRRLETTGVISGYYAKLDPHILDAAHVAMVQVQMQGTTSDALEALDRKSVGSGKWVSVRVYLGGLRNIKKKTTNIPKSNNF